MEWFYTKLKLCIRIRTNILITLALFLVDNKTLLVCFSFNFKQNIFLLEK